MTPENYLRLFRGFRPAHWDQLLAYIHDAQMSGVYWGNKKQYDARLVTLEGVISVIAKASRRKK